MVIGQRRRHGFSKGGGVGLMILKKILPGNFVSPRLSVTSFGIHINY